MTRYLLPFLVLLLGGCGSILTTKTPAPVYYQPEYEPASVSCEHSFVQGLRVWEFSAASPYNRPEMVVVLPGGEVQFSGTYQWVANPGAMVAEQLARDLSAGGLFPMVVTGDNPLVQPLELTGRVYRFSWLQEGEVSRAVLKVETSLIRTTGTRDVLFHRIYEMQSMAFEADNSSLFARAMGDLMNRFSERFRRDLCQVATEASRSGKKR